MTTVTRTLSIWRKLSAKPFGKRLFSLGVALKAPYFRTVWPRIEELDAEHAVVRSPLWWGVKNHIGTYHAIAGCNVAEIAMGVLAEAAVPHTHRWIPKGMTTRYLAKTTGGLTATARFSEPVDFSGLEEGRDVAVEIGFADRAGVESMHATITIWVSPRPPR